VASVLITGAGGFLGTWMTQEFIAQGHRVRAADLAGTDLSRHEAMGAEAVAIDVLKRPTIEAAAQGIEIMVHAAGIFDLSAPIELMWAVNRDGARTVAEVAAQVGVGRFVMISSTSVYGRKLDRVSEDHPKAPTHEYDRSKWAGEDAAVKACQAEALPYTVLRPTLIYGPGSRYGLASALALMALRAQHGLRRLPIAQGGPWGHHVHVEDVARAAVTLSTDERAVNQIYNIADDKPMAAGDLIRIFAEATGVTITTPAFPWWLTRMAGLFKPILRRFFVKENIKLAHIWAKLAERHGLELALEPRVDIDWVDYMFISHTFNNSSLKALGFSFKHPDSKQGLRETVAWYRQNRWLPTPPNEA
jgi:nucleoside-diphosphate-sugar epimerase